MTTLHPLYEPVVIVPPLLQFPHSFSSLRALDFAPLREPQPRVFDTMASSMHLSRLRKWFLASPPIEYAINSLKELLVGALRQGPIPQHVAFVMDGNRRFARSHGIETVEGHNLGFEALARVGLSWSR